MDDAKQIEIKRWLIKADHDVKAADASLKLEPPLTDVACFHAQQCAEKSLKAFMVFHDRQVLKTHDLLKLLMICAEYDPSFNDWETALSDMTAYAITQRYPDDWREILLPEAQEAVGNAKEVMAFVKGKIAL